jgi:hypothetical protein
MGYNPHKPGRPSHTYHSYLMANTRLVLEVDVQSGDRSHSSHSMPGLTQLLGRLPSDCQLAFIRGDCDWGNNAVMSELEEDILRFMENPLEPFTNNRGENDIRMTKVQQKISGCFQSEEGAKYFAAFGVIFRPVASKRSMHHRL